MFTPVNYATNVREKFEDSEVKTISGDLNLRGSGYHAVVEIKGKQYNVIGKSCGLPNCMCDAWIKEKEELPDEISITWCIDDIKGWDTDNPEDGVAPVTDNEARIALQAIKNNHDCEYGVTWNTIEFAVEEIRRNREEEK